MEAKIYFDEQGSNEVEDAFGRVSQAQARTSAGAEAMAKDEARARTEAVALGRAVEGLDRRARLDGATRSTRDYRDAIDRVDASQRRMAISTDSARSSITSMGSWIKGIGINSYLEIGRKILGAADALYRFADAGAEVAGLGAEYGRFEAQIESATTEMQVGVSVLLEASGALGIVGTVADVAGGFLGALGEVVSGTTAEVRTLGDEIDPVIEKLVRLEKNLESTKGAAAARVKAGFAERASRSELLVALDTQLSAMGQGAGGLSVAGYGQTQQVVINGHVYSTLAAKEEAGAIREAIGAEELYEAVRRKGGQAALDALAAQATTVEQMDKIVEASQMLAAEQEDLGSGSPKSKTKSSTALSRARAPEWAAARDALAAQQTLDSIKGAQAGWEGAFAWVPGARDSLLELADVMSGTLVDAYQRSSDAATKAADTQAKITDQYRVQQQAVAEAEVAQREAIVGGVGQAIGAGRQLAVGLISDTGDRALVEGAFETAAAAQSLAIPDFWGAINHGIAAGLFFATASQAYKKGGGGSGSAGRTQATIARPTTPKRSQQTEEERVVVFQLDGRQFARGTMRNVNRYGTRGSSEGLDARVVRRGRRGF